MINDKTSILTLSDSLANEAGRLRCYVENDDQQKAQQSIEQQQKYLHAMLTTLQNKKTLY